MEFTSPLCTRWWNAWVTVKWQQRSLFSRLWLNKIMQGLECMNTGRRWQTVWHIFTHSGLTCCTSIRVFYHRVYTAGAGTVFLATGKLSLHIYIESILVAFLATILTISRVTRYCLCAYQWLFIDGGLKPVSHCVRCRTSTHTRHTCTYGTVSRCASTQDTADANYMHMKGLDISAATGCRRTFQHDIVWSTLRPLHNNILPLLTPGVRWSFQPYAHNAYNTINATYATSGQWHGWNLSRDMDCIKLEACFRPCVACVNLAYGVVMSIHSARTDVDIRRRVYVRQCKSPYIDTGHCIC